MRKIVMVRDKGEITIPKELRDKYDIEHGTHYDVIEKENGDILLKRVPEPSDK